MMIALLFLLIMLQLADAFTTVRILKNGGREANPVMNWLFQKFGTEVSLGVMKILVVSLVAAAWNETLTFWLCVFYIGVVGWNAYQIVKE